MEIYPAMVDAAAALRGKWSAGGADKVRRRVAMRSDSGEQLSGMVHVGDFQDEVAEHVDDEQVGRPRGVGAAESGVGEQLEEPRHDLGQELVDVILRNPAHLVLGGRRVRRPRPRRQRTRIGSRRGYPARISSAPAEVVVDLADGDRSFSDR